MKKRKPFKIRSSFISRFEDGKQCDQALYYEAIEGKQPAPSKAMLNGQVFEYHFSGAKNQEGEIPMLPRGTQKRNKGEMLSEETRISEYAKEERKMVSDFGIDLSEYEVAPIWELDIYIAHLDLSKDCGSYNDVIDIKYSGLKWDDTSENGWGDPERRDANKINLQPLMYDFMSRKKFGKPIQFSYLVYGMDTDQRKWSKKIPVEISDKSKAEFDQRMLRFPRRLENWGKNRNTPGDRNVCRNCMHFDYCPVKTTKPTIDPIYI